MFKIGNIKIKNNVVLAPMAGISNPSFIKICEEMGVGLAFTELISAEAIVRNNKKTLNMLNGIEKLNIPVGVQIFGSNPDTMAQAAKILVDLHQIALIDINMGCPVPKVAIKNEAGSALLKHPDKIKKIVSKVVESVSVPVTVKIRSGWDEKHINAPLIAKICEDAGASAVSVHARTRKDGYTGKADLDVIKDVVKAINIPVIGNGDILSCYDAKQMLNYTGCAAVMIGRGALGNPWIFKNTVDFLEKGILPKEVTNKEKIDMMKKHVKMVIKDKGEYVGILKMRSNLMYYLKGLPNTKDLKAKICKCVSEEELLREISLYEENYGS